MKKTFIIVTLILFISSACLSADDFFSYLNEEERSVLLNTGEISKYFFNDEKPEYLFDSEFYSQISGELDQLDISIGAEALFFVKYSDLNIDTPLTTLQIYNTLLAVKSMEGIEYYSKSRKKMRTLFTKSYEVESLSNKTALDDPVLEEVPPLKIRYLLQKDKTFGENIYKTYYRSDGSLIWVNMINMTKMVYKFIPMVKPEKMSVNLFVKPLDEGLLFYGLTAAETTTFLGLEKSKKESFYNRIKAMYNWFTDQVLLDR